MKQRGCPLLGLELCVVTDSREGRIQGVFNERVNGTISIYSFGHLLGEMELQMFARSVMISGLINNNMSVFGNHFCRKMVIKE